MPWKHLHRLVLERLVAGGPVKGFRTLYEWGPTRLLIKLRTRGRLHDFPLIFESRLLAEIRARPTHLAAAVVRDTVIHVVLLSPRDLQTLFDFEAENREQALYAVFDGSELTVHRNGIEFARETHRIPIPNPDPYRCPRCGSVIPVRSQTCPACNSAPK